MLLDKYPKSTIDIYILVIESDGGCLPAAITAASMALCNAGIESYDLVPSCSVVEKKYSTSITHLILTHSALQVINCFLIPLEKRSQTITIR